MSFSPLRRLPMNAARLDEVLGQIGATLAAGAAGHDADGSFPHENFRLLHQHGLIALVVPVASGGGGGGLAEARRIIVGIAAGDAATALVLTMTYLQHRAIGRADTRWPQALQQQVFASAVEEGGLINSLRVEPELGSPARGGLPATTATRVGDQWRLQGHKLYTTGIPALRWLSVWGRTDEVEPRVGVFLVPRPSTDTPGIRVIESWNPLGLRASGSHETVFENIAIPIENAVDIRPPSAWTPNGASQVDVEANIDQQAWMVVLLGSLYDAVARAGYHWIRSFVRERTPRSLGSALSTLPRVQEVVGEIAALLHANEALLDNAAARADEGRPDPVTNSGLLKFTVTGNAVRAVELALQLAGNHGLSRNNPLERHYRDVLCSRIHTPQNDSILIAAGKAALEA
jgi:alkylation response protein AidB-like acyl-CoA dehydrogenase